jgi:hypothetical protein
MTQTVTSENELSTSKIREGQACRLGRSEMTRPDRGAKREPERLDIT